MKKTRQFLCAVIALLTAVTMLTGPFQTEVQAARTISTTATEWFESPPTFKKKGTYNINARVPKEHQAYIKFIAPKTGKYTFTFYDFRDWGKKSSAKKGFAEAWMTKQYPHGLETLKTKTNGGKYYTLLLASKWWYTRYVKGKKVTPTSELYSRYSKLSLKKGDVLYISTYWSNGKHQYKLKIK